MTKVEAVKALLAKKGGAASWYEIYDGIEEFYPAAKASKYWQEGIRGIVYREMRLGVNFKMASKGIVSLIDHTCNFVPQLGPDNVECCVVGDCEAMRPMRD